MLARLGGDGGDAFLGRRLEDLVPDDEETCEVSHLADPLGYLSFFQQPFSVAFYLLGMFYLFFGLGFVCEEYFVSAIEMITDVYQIPPDVAGATLM